MATSSIRPGDIFTRLTAESAYIKPSGSKQVTYWKCRCSCGRICDVRKDHLTTAKIRSCGCLRFDTMKTHGEAIERRKTPEYSAWAGIKSRCEQVGSTAYKRYGGAGIRVCERWNTFEQFLADMGRRPTAQHSVDRINNGGNYSPENCRWATQHQQQRNKSTNIFVSHGGRTMCVTDWALEHGMHPSTLLSRLHRGWSIEKSLSAPLQVHKRGT